jgi:hypothetical protein
LTPLQEYEACAVVVVVAAAGRVVLVVLVVAVVLLTSGIIWKCGSWVSRLNPSKERTEVPVR